MPHTYKARRGGYNWPEGGAPTPPACLCSTWAYGGGMGAFELHYAAGKFMSCIMQLIATHPTIASRWLIDRCPRSGSHSQV